MSFYQYFALQDMNGFEYLLLWTLGSLCSGILIQLARSKWLAIFDTGVCGWKFSNYIRLRSISFCNF